jgi:putative ABC transport system permease protein
MNFIGLLSKFAFRNLLRQRRRTLLTLFIAVSGGTGLILVGGFFDNIMRGLREQFIHGQSGHLQIGAPNYFRMGMTDPFHYLLPNAAALQAAATADPLVQTVLPRLKFTGLASSPDASVPVDIMGVDPDKERELGSFQYKDAQQPSMNISSGEDLSRDAPYDALLGRGLLDALQLHVGDVITLTTMHGGGTLDGDRFRICGTFETIVKDADDHSVKINLATAQRLFGLKNEIHTLVVVARRTEDVPVLMQRLDSSFKKQGLPHSFITWQELGAMCIQSEALFRKVYVTIQMILSFIIFCTVANTINMSLLERVREYGTMMALGNSRAFILLTILSEGFVLGMIGAAASALIGSAAAAIVSRAGIEMPPPPMGTHAYYAMIELSPRLLWEAGRIIWASSVLATIGPSLRIANMSTVEALGYV